jgi:hypothetical protein
MNIKRTNKVIFECLFKQKKAVKTALSLFTILKNHEMKPTLRGKYTNENDKNK